MSVFSIQWNSVVKYIILLKSTEASWLLLYRHMQACNTTNKKKKKKGIGNKRESFWKFYNLWLPGCIFSIKHTYLQNILLARKVIKHLFTLSLLLKLICILHHRELLVNFHTARCEQSSDNKPWIIQRCNSIHRITPKPKCLYLHKSSPSLKNPNTKPGFAMHWSYQHFLKLKGWVEISWKLALPVRVVKKRATSWTCAVQLHSDSDRKQGNGRKMGRESSNGTWGKGSSLEGGWSLEQASQGISHSSKVCQS